MLIYRLSDPACPHQVNLKEFRDILLNYRASPSVVISWGVCNEGRLGIGNPEQVHAEEMMASKNIFKDDNEEIDRDAKEELMFIKPHIVKFPIKIKSLEANNIIKVA